MGVLIKWFLYLMNLLLTISGIGLVYLGYYEKETLETYFNIFYGSLPFSVTCVPYIVMVLGVWATLVGLFGCCNCIEETLPKLKRYAYFLEALLVVKIAFTIALYTDFWASAGSSFVSQNFSSDFYEVMYMQIKVYAFLQDQAIDIRNILAYFLILELIIVLCLWPRRTSLKNELLKQQIMAQRSQMATITVNVPTMNPGAAVVH